jgi:predicted transcriptional regulator
VTRFRFMIPRNSAQQFFRKSQKRPASNLRICNGTARTRTPYTLSKMPSVLVQLDDATYKALNQVVAPANRKRTEFIHAAIKEAIRRRVNANMREAYRSQPVRAAESDSWSNCEKFEP